MSNSDNSRTDAPPVGFFVSLALEGDNLAVNISAPKGLLTQDEARKIARTVAMILAKGAEVEEVACEVRVAP